MLFFHVTITFVTKGIHLPQKKKNNNNYSRNAKVNNDSSPAFEAYN